MILSNNKYQPFHVFNSNLICVSNAYDQTLQGPTGLHAIIATSFYQEDLADKGL